MTSISPIFANISSGLGKYRWTQSNSYSSSCQQKIDFLHDMPWVKDKSIATALNELKMLEFADEDIKYLRNMGVETPFKSGKDAVDLIEKQNIRIIYDETNESGVHAQYDFYKNLIVINNKYRKTDDFAVMLAIAEAILHETGHAKDKDGYSSVQEELDFLGMNAIAHRAFVKKYGDIFSDSKAPIIKDGVKVYAKLFFDPDPDKKALVKRITDKYGNLPAGDSMHPPGLIARIVKKSV